MLAAAAAGLFGWKPSWARGGEQPSAKGLAACSPPGLRGGCAFSLQQFSLCRLRGFGGDGVSSSGRPKGWGWSPLAWGHG